MSQAPQRRTILSGSVKPSKSDVEKASDIVRDFGGTLIGRTRLQKTACLLELAGLGGGFSFGYRHYGPYCEELAQAVRDATFIGLIKEQEESTEWGGRYSIYSVVDSSKDSTASKARKDIASIAAAADSVLLELAVTAAFLASQGEKNAWQETANRKPEKAKDGRLEKAKALYKAFQAIPTPKNLPALDV